MCYFYSIIDLIKCKEVLGKERYAFFEIYYIRFFLYLKEKPLKKEAENLAGLSLVKRRNNDDCDSPRS